jgi:polyisoprenoid-binding protein YceI
MKPAFFKSLSLLFLLGAGTPAIIRAEGFVKDGPASVTFSAAGTAGLRIEGQTVDLQIRDGEGTLTIRVPLDNFTTGIGLRDRHMKEKYLETMKFPKAELKISRTDLQLPEEGSQLEGKANGVLTLHGCEKTVSFNYRVRRSRGIYEVSGTLPINMNEYGINVPSYLGITVKPQVQVQVEFRAKEG